MEINTEAPLLKSDCDITVTQDDTTTTTSSDTSSSSVMQLYENNTLLQGIVTPKAVTPSSENVNVYKNVFQLTPSNLKHVDNTDRKAFLNRIYNEFEEKSITRKDGNLSRSPSLYEKDTASSSKNFSTSGTSKWSTEKEKFLESSRHLDLVKAQYTEKNIDMLKNLNIDCDKSKITKDPSELNILKATPGAVVIKEKYIEPPKVTRVSRSFHGKSNTACSMDAACAAPRRASDGVSVVNLMSDNKEKLNAVKRKFVSQLSQSKSPSRSVDERKSSLTDGTGARLRFTTTIVDEAEHAASVGLRTNGKRNSDNESLSTEEKQ